MSMSRIKISSLLFVVFLYSQVNAQNFGFNGKKNTISLFSTGGIRVFPLAIGFVTGDPTLDIIKYSSSNQMKRKTKIASYDLRFSYTRLVNKKFGIGAEFGYEKFALPMINNFSYYDEYGYYIFTDGISDQSTPVFDVFSYMLVFEFHSSRGAAPIGFSSSLGIGPKMYKFDFGHNYRYNQSLEMTNPYPKGASDIMAINFFYQLNYKKVLNNFMTFDIGMRFHTGVVLPTTGSSINSEYSRNELRDELFTHNLGSLISLRMGFSFLL